MNFTQLIDKERFHVSQYLKYVNKDRQKYRLHFWKADYYHNLLKGNIYACRIALSKLESI